MLFQLSILREKIAVFFIILFTLLTVVSVFLVIRGLSAAAVGDVSLVGVLQLMMISILRYVPLIVVMTTVVAIVMTISRLYQSSEMAVWQASGMGSLGLLKPIGMLVVPLFGLLLVLNLFITPWSNGQLKTFQKHTQAEELSLLKSGTFKTTANGQRTIYIGDVEDSSNTGFKDIFIVQRNKDETIIEAANHATLENSFDNRPFMVLEKGKQYQDKPVVKQMQTMLFERYGVSMDEFTGLKPLDLNQKAVALMNTTELLTTNVAETKNAQMGELYRRISDSIMIIPMALIALVLGYVKPRTSGNFLGILAGLIFFMLYLNMIKMGQSRIENARWTVTYAFALIHGTTLMIALAGLWYRVNSWRISSSKMRLKI